MSEFYPYESHYHALERGGHRLHYLDEGQGPETIVMVHGNPSWSYYFRELVGELSGQARVIVPDHVGCGLSDKPGDEDYSYRLERRVDDLDALLESLGVEGEVSLVLHDWGGMIGLAWAHRHPGRIRRLVLLNTSGFRLPPSKPFPWTLRLARGFFGALLVRGFNAFSRGAARYCVTRRPMPAEVRAAYLAPYDSWSSRIAVHRFVEDIPLDARDPSWQLVCDVEGGLERYRSIPVLICWGARDFVFDDHFLAEWRTRLPEAEVHRFADAGHYVLEDAREDVVPLVRAFFARPAVAQEAS